MEAYLTPHIYGRLGTTRILKNKRGAIVEVLDSTQPKDGLNVELSIDIDLQQVCEQALRDNIEATREKQEKRISEDRAKYLRLSNGNTDSIKRAETGAVIVMNVKTGEILAMASYPDYDPNLFTDGVDETENDLLFGEGSNQPTLNRAIGIRTASGSVFKMTTGLAGLMEGKLSTTEMISDNSPYYYFVDDPTTKVEQNAPSCWTSNPRNHANLTLSRALTVSCNYFFYTVSDRVGIERLNYWAGRLGMKDTTGIELPGELTVQIGGQKARYDCEKPLSEQTSALPRLIYNRIYNLLKTITTQNGYPVSNEMLRTCADRLLRLMDAQSAGRSGNVPEQVIALGAGAVRSTLEDLRRQGISYAVLDTLADADLDVLAESLADMPLVTGGSGLGGAIARRYARMRGGGSCATDLGLPASGGKTILLSGSCSEMTNRQVAAYAAKAYVHKADITRCMDDAEGYAQEIFGVAAAHTGDALPPLISATVPPAELKTIQAQWGVAQSSRCVERFFARLAVLLRGAGYDHFIIAGGETSSVVSQALMVKGFYIGPQIAPGVPWVRTLDRSLSLALKSGNFGDEAFFAKALSFIPAGERS